MEAVARQLGERHVIPELACLGDVGETGADQVDELLLGLGDVFVSMQERVEFGGDVVAALNDQREGPEYHFEPFVGVCDLVSEFGEMLEAAGDMTGMPGDEDRFYVGEVLVQRRPADAGVLGDLRHGHRGQTVLYHQRPRGVQDRR